MLLDTAKGLENFVNDEDDYREILGCVLDTAKDDLAELKSYRVASNIEDFTIKAHGMKSQCNLVGAIETGLLAKELEFAGKDNDWALIDSKLPGFIENYKALLDEVTAYLG